MDLKRWVDIELELSRKHEEIIMRREALLRGTECYFNTDDCQPSSFIVDIKKAEERNQNLVKNVNEMLSNIRRKERYVSPQFETLTKNYWSMVRSVFPVWYEQFNKESRSSSNSNQESHIHIKSAKQSQFKAQHSSPNAKKTTKTHDNHKDRRRQVRWSEEDSAITDVPRLNLDFSGGEDMTSQDTTLKSATLETNASLQSTDKQDKKEKRVHYDEAQLSAAARKSSQKSK